MDILFTGNKPQKKTYSYSVKENNNSNIITFILNKEIEGVDLSTLSCFVKVQGSGFLDKDVPSVEVEEDKIKVHWTLLRKATSYRVLSVQLQFEGSEDIVWQTEILTLVLSETIKADEYIENKYPAVLTNHEARIINVENQNEVQEEEISALEEKIAQALAGVFHYKGSVATYEDLPSQGQEVGDTYNVLDSGDNYTWNGSEWDKLSGIVDLSNFYNKDETDILLNEKADKEDLNDYVDLASEQTISGVKTFLERLRVKKATEGGGYFEVYPDGNGMNVKLIFANNVLLMLHNGGVNFYRDLLPDRDGTRNIGSSGTRIKKIFVKEGISDGTSEVAIADLVKTKIDVSSYLNVDNSANLTIKRKELYFVKTSRSIKLYCYFSAKNESGSQINSIRIINTNIIVADDFLKANIKDMNGVELSSANAGIIGVASQEIYYDGNMAIKPIRLQHSSTNQLTLYDGSAVNLPDNGNLIIEFVKEWFVE